MKTPKTPIAFDYDPWTTEDGKCIQLQVKAALNYDKLLAKLRNSEGERSIRDQQNALITSLNLKLGGISM